MKEYRNEDGLLHRTDGPAIVYADGEEAWYINSVNITDKINQFFKDHNVKNYDELSPDLKILFKMTVICAQ